MKRYITLLLLLGSVASASAQAATVGPNCKISWNAPTTNVDGSVVTPGELTAYRIYVDKGTIVPNVTAPTQSVAATVTSGVQVCAGLAAGNHVVAVSAVAGPNEGAALALPFVLVTATPGPPSNLQVLP